MTRSVRHLTTLAVGLLAALSVSSPTAQAASIVVSPTTVAPGGTVRLSGDTLVGGTPGCGAPSHVLLVSEAFVGLGEFAGTGAVDLPVDATGHFDSTVTLSPTVAEGTYLIGGRCGGSNIGVSATLEIKNLPATGQGIAVWPTVAMAAGLVLSGLALLMVRRRHRSSAA
jgi:LPXTG-motif cell wall-anchored protein